MHKRPYLLPCLVLSILVPATTAFPRTAVALAPAEPKALDVRVETSLGEAEEQKLAASVRDAIVERIRGKGIEISDDAPSSLLVTIGWVGKSRSDLEVKYIVTKGDGDPRTARTSVCAACGSREMIAAIDGDLAPLWDMLDDAATPKSAEAQPETGPTPSTDATRRQHLARALHHRRPRRSDHSKARNGHDPGSQCDLDATSTGRSRGPESLG